MFSLDIIGIACLLTHVLGGGRWSITLATCVFFLVRWCSPKDYEKQEVRTFKNSSIFEIDFTTTGPSSETQISLEKNSNSKSLFAKRSKNKRVIKIKAAKNDKNLTSSELVSSACKIQDAQVYIFYSTLTGTSKRISEVLRDRLSQLANLTLKPKLLSLDDDLDDLEQYFLNTPNQDGTKNIYLMVFPSYDTDSPIDYFLEHLEETYNDFRIDKYPLRKLLGFAVLGLGDSESWPGEKFCYQAELCDKWLGKLGGRRLHPLGKFCMKYDGELKTETWIKSLLEMLKDEEPSFLDENNEIEDDSEDDTAVEEDGLVDVEDMGKIMSHSRLNNDVVKKMVAKDSPTHKTLTKQGYTVVGSHSGVKICRWTKSALRGRGSCYKFAFYGIKSHLCMETTPSLACSNKCVFCWRHGTNPVAKSNWRWEVDPPEKIMQGALEGHYKKIKQMRGVPGVQMDRFQEAFQVKHCALSLVGEPIFYPHINEFVGMLHTQGISSFLVCNAQHPDQLERLHKVTQLYVSIDAPNRSDLKKVDRPLNSDFWERLIKCLDILRTVQAHQRTVFRLTLVKGFNMDEIEGYADMVERAQPSQIEVKGATFCGSSSANGNPLTMQNIPFYEECKNFVTLLTACLRKRGLEYSIAAEHAHSCCILIAHDKFFFNEKWHTHIDYPKFFKLLETGEEFTDIDYVKETPEWAYWGSTEAGFNPTDTKFERNSKKKSQLQTSI